MLTHPQTGFTIGDPFINPLAKSPTPSEACSFFEGLILSASGWRGVFASSDEDMGETITPAKAYAVARMADVFARFLTDTLGPSGIKTPRLALGIDTRPTGPAIADVMARVFLARGISVQYAFICAAPEIMAWTRRSSKLAVGNPDRLDAFCYISASHNPAGHNGVKFGMSDGGVLAAEEAKSLIAWLKDGACSEADIAAMAELVGSASPKSVSALYAACGSAKRRAISDYTLFAREVTGASDSIAVQEQELGELETAIALRGSGVIADMNGSARCLSIDEDFLSGLGVSLHLLNAEPRGFAHRIVPEGESLEPCRIALARARAKDPSFVIGYVPDCDGDRGNIVYWDDHEEEARSLLAQDTFALAVLAELASMASGRLRRGEPEATMAVACNDATSLRVDAIARVFDASLFRSETGEANVVGLARSLRDKGYLVRVLGEGSNGGVITHPAGVRDPLNTVVAILKLLYLRDLDGSPGPYRLWLERSGQGSSYRDDFTLSDVLSSLPRFVTTSVFEDRAALRVHSVDHASLKNRYEAIFRARWPSLANRLEPIYGRLSWKPFASSGILERELHGSFGDSGSGGLKISLFNESGDGVAFLWMRGSGTEPVFRIMADARGDDEAIESILLDFHATIVIEADAIA